MAGAYDGAKLRERSHFRAKNIESTMKIDRSEQKANKFHRGLVKYEALPEYLKDNEFILDYYRSEWPLKDAFLSVFSWHNETLNVWTHLGGFVVFLALTLLSLTETPLNVEPLLFAFTRNNSENSASLMMMKKNNSNNLLPQDLQRHQVSMFQMEEVGINSDIPRWPWFVFLAGAMGCLVCSSLSHLLACHSLRLNLFFWRLDYAGISLMIVSSFVAPIYYAFFCHPIFQILYLTSISLFGALAIITLLSPALSAPRFRPFRASLFLTMGFSGVIPAAHAITLHWGHHSIFVSLAYELVMALCYATGAGFYMSRVPERWKPGAFDIAGHSHQIFHVFVVAGALAHYAATLVIMDWRLASPSCGN